MAVAVPQVPYSVLWAQPQWQRQSPAGPLGVPAPACRHQCAGHGPLGSGEGQVRGDGDRLLLPVRHLVGLSRAGGQHVLVAGQACWCCSACTFWNDLFTAMYILHGAWPLWWST
jgi:hypothetical protein